MQVYFFYLLALRIHSAELHIWCDIKALACDEIKEIFQRLLNISCFIFKNLAINLVSFLFLDLFSTKSIAKLQN